MNRVFWVGKIVEKGTKSYKLVMSTWCNSSWNSKHKCKIGCLNYKLQPLYCHQNMKLSIICQKNLSNYNMYEKGMRKRRKKWRDCSQGFELSTIVHRVVCEGSCKSPKLCMRVMLNNLKPIVIKKNRSNSKKRRRTKKKWVFHKLFWCCKIWMKWRICDFWRRRWRI